MSCFSLRTDGGGSLGAGSAGGTLIGEFQFLNLLSPPPPLKSDINMNIGTTADEEQILN
jgi:hypothetical protein